MMNLTLDQLIDHLNEDLGWRKTELTKLSFMENVNDELKSKSMILLIYSHWEGYIKNACKQYLIHISDRNLKLSLLTESFKAISLKGMISEVLEHGSSLTLSNELALINKFDNPGSKKFKVPSKIKEDKNKDFINTHDNLNLKTLNNFCKIIGITQITMIEGKSKYIDETLLNQRNTISHGSKIDTDSNEFTLDINDINQLRDFSLLIMEYIKEEIIHFAENEYYLRSKSEEVETRKQNTSENLRNQMEEIFS